jgi:hypothetical protein
MIKKVQVEGNPNLYRDKYSGAVLNCNLEEVKLAKMKRQEKEKAISLEKTVDNMKKEISDIKELLNNLIREIKK